jgi:hypothetical protein
VQEPGTQPIPLREYAADRGMTITNEYVDVGISRAKAAGPVNG